jgi:transcription antitermination factor NusG
MNTQHGNIAWYVIQTRPNQEKKVMSLMEEECGKRKNLLEAYCPTNHTVRIQHAGKVEERPIFSRKVFVLGTREDVLEAMRSRYPDGFLAFDKTQNKVMTIPDLQMQFFRDFNEHYPEKVMVLERPYSDYAFNAKNGEANETVMVLDGPFAGKTGYLIRARNNKRLVFQMQDMAISIPDIWDYRLARLHNTKGDRQTKGTMKGRAVDYLNGVMQGFGYDEDTAETMRLLLDKIAASRSIIQSVQTTALKPELAKHLQHLSADGASTLLQLAALYKEDSHLLDPLDETLTLRPFLTPTAGKEEKTEAEYTELQHGTHYRELIRKMTFKEPTYCATDDSAQEVDITYYAHIGIRKKTNGQYCLFANWHPLLKDYILLGGEAKEKQQETLKTFSPLFYEIVMGQNNVKIAKDMKAGHRTGHTLCLHTGEDGIMQAAEELTDTCLKLCLEINGNAHLALWRRLLRDVWLHL